MKGWITVLVVIALLILVGYLQSIGYFNFDWKPLTILFAALAAPFKMLMNAFNGTDTVKDITMKHQKVREEEENYRKTLNAEIERRANAIHMLEKEVEVLDARIETLETRKAALSITVKNMTSEQKQEKFKELFGQ